eukprot:m.277256 g.277256  ORF g.277256 m.277256 type:complete len:285 (-) comp54870_c0_seq6:24-878(-)
MPEFSGGKQRKIADLLLTRPKPISPSTLTDPDLQPASQIVGEGFSNSQSSSPSQISAASSIASTGKSSALLPAPSRPRTESSSQPSSRKSSSARSLSSQRAGSGIQASPAVQGSLTSFMDAFRRKRTASQAKEDEQESQEQLLPTETTKPSNETESCTEIDPSNSPDPFAATATSLEDSQSLPSASEGPKRIRSEEALAAWKTVLAKAKIPLCRGHSEPAVLRVVKKDGPTKGKRFFCCARPDVSCLLCVPRFMRVIDSRCSPQGAPNDPRGRCNFFEWEIKKK